MQIIIDKDYAIAADKDSWVIQKRQERSVNGVKETYWRTIKWFVSCEGAIKELVDLRLRTSDCSTLSEALEYNKSVVGGIVRALAPDIKVTIK